ncbi:MAG: Na(+)-translocating NADH-quinone reductase subunit A [Cryomorphaceae bacterium]|nr:MAG: Na(+)-translocating NADH-quinone reductase subunit A [Cryomorphaceae bacterium]
MIANLYFCAEKSNLKSMSKDIRLKKGLNINLLGEADKVYASVKPTKRYVVKPTDFHTLTPKLAVKVGDKVKAGTILFFDKYNDKVNFCAPVSGEVIDIVRGAKRKILEVVLEADAVIEYEQFNTDTAKNISRVQIIDTMLKAGIWPFVRQKPYDIVANPTDMPKAIFISAFNSAPLTIDNDFALYGLDELFQKGLDYITQLTSGKTHLNIDGNTNPATVFTGAKGVEINKISGAHPSGNVGIQVHHINPINKGEVIWYLQPQDVIAIARLFTEGKYDVSRIVALSGSQVKKPKYYRTIAGATISNLLADNITEGDNRIISGDILTGQHIEVNGTLGFYDTTITVIEEGKEQEFLGWILPGLHKFSASKTFLSWLTPSKKYTLNANMHGEERAYVMTGEYEKVLPMDIFPAHLIKACMIEDIELMENLGIYEVSPEDFALCEFVCTSKIEVQTIIRNALELVRKENS